MGHDHLSAPAPEAGGSGPRLLTKSPELKQSVQKEEVSSSVRLFGLFVLFVCSFLFSPYRQGKGNKTLNLCFLNSTFLKT